MATLILMQCYLGSLHNHVTPDVSHAGMQGCWNSHANIPHERNRSNGLCGELAHTRAVLLYHLVLRKFCVTGYK